MKTRRQAREKRDRFWGKWLRIAAMTALAVGALVSGSLSVRERIRASQEEEVFAALRETVRGAAPKTEAENGKNDVEQMGKIQDDDAYAARFLEYQNLQNQNPDFSGWLRIEGTQIDYPVMYTPGRPDYYLYRNFFGEPSRAGTLYLAEQFPPEQAGANLLIYGHHMRDGRMFGDLKRYLDQEFFRQHPNIFFDTVVADTAATAGKYEIAAVLLVPGQAENQDKERQMQNSAWQQLLCAQSEAEFAEAWEIVQGKRLYDTGVELARKDQILALATCEYSERENRLLILARLVSF